MYHGILGALGGTQDITMHRDAQTGEMQVTKVNSTPGTQWKRIIAGALAGVAGGANAGTGPGHMTRALAGGVQGGMQLAQQREETMQKTANEDEQQRRETMTSNAQNAILTQERSARDFEMTRKQVESRYLDNDKMQSFIQGIADAGGEDLGVFPDAAAAMQHVNQDPTAVNMLARGRLVMMPALDENNKYVGNHYAIEPEGYDTQLLTRDMPMPRIGPPTAAGGNYSVTWDTVRAGTPGYTNAVYDKLFSAQIGFLEKLDHTEMQNNEAMTKTQDLEGPDGKTHTYGWNTKTQMFDRDQGLTKKAPATNISMEGTWQLAEDKQGNPILFNSKTGATQAAPEGMQKSGTHAKVQDAMAKENEPVDKAISFADDYIASPVHTGALDEALMEQYFEVTRPSKGFRMSQPQQDMLKKARSWQGSAEAYVRHAQTGEWFTQTQRKEIHGAMTMLAKAKRSAISKNYGVEPEAAPTPGAGAPGGGPPATPATLPPAATGGANWDTVPKIEPHP